MRAPRPIFAALLVGLVLTGCEGAFPTRPPATPTSTPVGTSPSPDEGGSSTSSAPSTTPAPSATPAPTPTAAETFTAAEQSLVDAIRADSRIGCAPRRTDLPAFATAGVECTIGSDTVERVGAYGFGPATDERGNAVDGAMLAYTNRLAEYGVKLRQGDCDAGRNGDRAWPANVTDDVDAPLETRSGCYIDEGHHANVRVTCYGSIYIGVLGAATTDVFSAGKAIRDLYGWTWSTAPDEIGDRDPPGICAAPD